MKVHKLTKPNITKVDAVPDGANQGAAIMLYKSRLARNIADTVSETLAKGQAVPKAQTFDAKIREGLVRERINQVWWPFTDTLRESIMSILIDPNQTPETRKSMLETTLKEFADALIPKMLDENSPVAKEGRKISSARRAALLRSIREQATIIFEADGNTDAMQDILDDLADDADDEDNDDDEEGEVGKGDEAGRTNTNKVQEVSGMKIDKSKFTPEELKVWDALVAKGAVNEEGTPPATAQAQASASSDEVTKALESATAALRETTERFNKMQDEMAIKELTAEFKKYEPVGKPEELAKAVYDLRKAGKTAEAENFIKALDTAAEAIKKSATFTEVGKTGGAMNDAEQALDAAAREIQKSKPNLTYAQAMEEVGKTKPELVAAYEQARAQRR